MRLTRFGAAIIAILIICAVLIVLTSGTLRFAAALIAGVLVLAMVGEGVGSGFAKPEANLGRMGEFARKREVLTRDADLRRQARRQRSRPR